MCAGKKNIQCATRPQAVPFRIELLSVEIYPVDSNNEGGNILGEQVSLKATPDGPRWIVDIVYEKSTTIYAVEVKTGPYADFTPNQKIVIPQIQETRTAIPVGGNASQAGFEINQRTDIRVRIIRK